MPSIWAALERDDRAERHAAAAFLLACACLWLLQPITGVLVPADLGPRAFGGRAGLELAAWALLILAGPLLLHEVFAALGGRARRAPSLTALYGTYVAFCAAAALARAALPAHAFACSCLLAAAGAWLVYGQLVELHGLAPQTAAAGLGAALALWVLAPAALARAYPRAVTDRLILEEGPVLRLVSWPAEAQPGGEGQVDAAREYKKADALVVGMVSGSTVPARVARQLEKPTFDADAEREFGGLLEKNAAALAAFRRAAKLPYCDFTDGTSTMSYDNSFPNRFKPLRLASLTLLDARREQARGRWGPATDDYVAALGMARHFAVQRNQLWANVFCWRIIVEKAWPGLSALISEGKTSRPDAERLLAALRALEESKPSLAKAVDGEERRLELTAEKLGALEAEIFSEPYRRSLVDARLEVLARHREAVVEAAEKRRPDLLSRELAVAWRDYSPPAKNDLYDSYGICLADPKVAGRCWGEINLLYSMGYDSAIVYHSIAETALGVLTAAAAVRDYQARRGAPPKSLSALTPDFLSAVPPDPFDESRPLRYARDGGTWTVYGVGPDRVDDGGRVAFDMSQEYGGRHWTKLPKGDLLVRASARRN